MQIYLDFLLWITFFVISECWTITKNNLIKTFQNWGDVFNVEFTIEVKSLTNLPLGHIANIFQFSNSLYIGDRLPSLSIRDEELYVYSLVNGVHDYSYSFKYELGKQYQMTIKQVKAVNGKYWYEIIVDGESKLKIENTQPKNFQNVHLYGSDPSSIPFSSDMGSICNVKIHKGEGELGNALFC